MCIRDREAQSSQQTAEVKKQRIRLATAKQRVSELEVLLCKIYEDNILGKLSDSRYEMCIRDSSRSSDGDINSPEPFPFPGEGAEGLGDTLLFPKPKQKWRFNQ